MKRTTRRYWVTMLLGISFIAAFAVGWGTVFVKLIEFKAMEPIKVAWLVTGLASWVTAAYLVVREKGRSVVWVVVVFFFAPLLLVLLFLPHATRRRAVLESRSFELT